MNLRLLGLEEVIAPIKDELRSLSAQVKSMNPSNESPVYTNKQVAQGLGVSPRTLHKYRKEGLITCSKVGRKIFYSPKDIENFLFTTTNAIFKGDAKSSKNREGKPWRKLM